MASKGKGARLKGSGLELKIAKILTAWAGNGVTFTRSPNSGAWGSTHGTYSAIAGDIATEYAWPFNFELKNHETFTSLDTIYHSQANIQSFWNQSVQDAVRTKKVPILLNHRNRSKHYISMPYSETVHLAFKNNGLDYGIFNIRWHHDALDHDFSTEVITVVLEDFLAQFSYEYLIANHENMFSDWYKLLETDKDVQGLA